MSKSISKLRSDMTIEDQLIQKIEELEKRLDFLEKTNKAFRDNVNDDIENITRRISARPSDAIGRPPQEKANEINWTDLARRQKSPYYLETPPTNHLRTAII